MGFWSNIVVFCFFINTSAISAEDGPQVIDIPRGDDIVVDQGLVPLYSMARGFLTNLVQTNDLQFMEDRGVNFTDWDDVVNHDFSDWAEYFIGYAIWSAIGIVTLIGMLITGFVLLCCCCCPCCKSSDDAHDKPSKVCYITLSITLFLVTTAMIPPTAFMVVSGVRLREQVQSDDNMFDTVRRGIIALDSYANDTVYDMEFVIIGSVTNLTENTMQQFEDMEEQIYADFSEQTGASSSLDDLTQLNSDLIFIDDTVIVGQRLSGVLLRNRSSLSFALDYVRPLINASIINCETPDCEQAQNDLYNLEEDATYQHTLISLSALNRAISPIVQGGELEEEVTRAQEEYNSTITSIEEDISEITIDANEELDVALADMENYIEDVTAKVEEFDFDSALQEVDDIEDDAYTPADILFWSIVGICALIVLIIVWNYIGILIGVCCSASDSSTCNRAVGSTVLKLGVVMTFLVQWLFMILLIVTFLGSGILYTEFCRHMVAYNESAVADIMDDILEGTVLDTVDVNLVVSDVYTDCGQDMAFYTAFDLDQNNLNITEIVYDARLDEEIDKLRDYDVGHNFSVAIMSPELEAILGNISDAFSSVTFHYDELNKGVVAMDVDDYILDLENLLGQAGVENDDLQSAIDDLTVINTRYVVPMENDKADLITVLEQLEEAIGEPDRVETIETNLITAESNVNNFTLTNGIMEGNRDDTVTEVERLLEETRQSIEYNVETTIGRCFSVYHVIVNVTDEVCVKTLYPIHGFWFSLGWCYVLLVVSVILSLLLAAELRKVGHERTPDKLKKTKEPMRNQHNRKTLHDDKEMFDLNQADNNGMVCITA